MGVGTIVVGQLPRMLKGLVVPIFNMPLRYYRAKTIKALMPLVERQLEDIRDGRTKLHEQDYDLISQSARISMKLYSIRNIADPSALAEWILLQGFAALSSTILLASNLLLDVASCDPEQQAYDLLRGEAAALLRCDNDWNNPQIFKDLILYDSVIRETARCHPILIKGLTKEVVRPDGLCLPDGTHIPQGGWLGIPVLGLHMDERFHPNAQQYDPFRWARMRIHREHANLRDLTEKSPKIKSNDLDATQPSPTFVGFGYGRHACPGRWFAVQFLKILFAYLILNYDIESTGPQPKMQVIGDAALPPTSATVRVRRWRRKLE
ncbi:MAG: hypothetical protein Q9228_002455 [Teloschistes exilis]